MATSSTYWRRALTTNSTNTTALVTKDWATSPPLASGVDADEANGIFRLDRLADSVHSLLKIMPFGTNAADETFEGEVWIWHPDNGTGASRIWIPELVLVYTATLGAVDTGTASEFVADTITEDAGDTATSRLVSFGDDSGPATLLMDVTGAEFIEFEFDIGTAADANCMWRLIS